MKEIPIFSLSVAQELLNNGFVVVNIKQNTKFVDKLVFYFNREENIIKYLKDNMGIEV